MELTPDLQKRYAHLSKVSKTTDQEVSSFIQILKSQAEIQSFYAKSLQRLSTAVAKVSSSKGPIKDLFGIAQKIMLLNANSATSLSRFLREQIQQRQQSLQKLPKQQLTNSKVRMAGFMQKLQRMKQDLANLYLERGSLESIKFQKLSQHFQKEYRKFTVDFNAEVDCYFSNLANMTDFFKSKEDERRAFLLKVVSSYVEKCVDKGQALVALASEFQLDRVCRQPWLQPNKAKDEEGRQVCKVNAGDLIDELQQNPLVGSGSISAPKSFEEDLQQKIKECSL